MLLTRLCLLLLVGLLVACSNNEIKPSTKPTPTGSISLEKHWSAFVGFGANHRDYRYQIAVREDTLYVIGKNGRFYAIDKTDGSRLWYHELDFPLTTGVTLHDSLALLGNEDGQLIAFDVSSREIVWRTDFQSEILHPPVTDGAVIAVQVNNGTLYSVDINTGSILWSIVTKNPALTQRGTATPLIVDGLIIAGFATGKLILLNAATGVRVWETEVGQPKGNNEVGRLVDIDGNIFLHNGIVYASAAHGELLALNLQQQPKVDWSVEFSSASGVTGLGDTVFATDSSGVISAFAQKNGDVLWSQTDMNNYNYNNPVMWQGYLVVADQLGYINMLNPNDGSLAGLYRSTPYAVQANFLVEENQIYVLDIAGYLSALRPEQ